jgi:hypothetical protein
MAEWKKDYLKVDCPHIIIHIWKKGMDPNSTLTQSLEASQTPFHMNQGSTHTFFSLLFSLGDCAVKDSTHGQ